MGAVASILEELAMGALVGFGGARDGCSSVGFGYARLESLWRACSPGFGSCFGGEVVEFVLRGCGDCVDVFGIRRRGPVYRQFGDP